MHMYTEIFKKTKIETTGNFFEKVKYSFINLNYVS